MASSYDQAFRLRVINLEAGLTDRLADLVSLPSPRRRGELARHCGRALARRKRLTRLEYDPGLVDEYDFRRVFYDRMKLDARLDQARTVLRRVDAHLRGGR